MQTALSPSQKALVAEQLLRHSDPDVKVAVASCISEITRITAPDAPYDDDQMKVPWIDLGHTDSSSVLSTHIPYFKENLNFLNCICMQEVFQLIVSSFENLYDKSSRSYAKRTSILETVAKVRSCVVMLDLECDALILEMFQHFLKSIRYKVLSWVLVITLCVYIYTFRNVCFHLWSKTCKLIRCWKLNLICLALNVLRDYHPENVFSSMETIMTLVLEESEDISLELISPLLDSVKNDNEVSHCFFIDN